MVALKLKKGARHQLKSLAGQPQIIEVQHRPGVIDHVLLPCDAFQNFQFAPLEHDVVIRAENLEARESSPSLWDRHSKARILKKSRFASPLRYGGCIYSFERSVKGDPRVSLANNRGMDLGSESLATLLSSQMIRDDIPELPDRDAPSPQFSGTIAVVLHLHYTELWDEISTFLKHSKINFRLIVTLTEPNATLEAKILSSFSGAVIKVVENLGRDIRPFVTVLQSGLLEGVDLICKLHGKRSTSSGVAGGRFGLLWRRRVLLDLLGSPLQVQKILSRFEVQPGLGMIGPATLRLKNGSGSDPGFEASYPIRKDLCERASLNPDHIKEDFFAGTMFWVRKDAFEPLDSLPLDKDVFTDEAVQIGDQFEHGLERFFADSTRASGFYLADIEPLALVDPDIPIRSKDGHILAPRALFEAPRAMYRHNWPKPLPNTLEGRKVALVTSAARLRDTQESGYLACLCLAVPDPQTPRDTTADAMFLRETGGFNIALLGDALKSAPQLWEAEELLLVTKEMSINLSHVAMANPETRALFEDAIVWHKESEANHRYGAALHKLGMRLFEAT